jgi:hypothetical protein
VYRQHEGPVRSVAFSFSANLSKCSDQEIAAIKLALQHKHDLAAFRENAQLNPNFTLRQGLSIGAIAVLEALARELGLVKALGTGREGKLALWQVIARVIDQGSRLSAVRLAQTHACCDLLKLDAFNEDDLYLSPERASLDHVLTCDRTNRLAGPCGGSDPTLPIPPACWRGWGNLDCHAASRALRVRFP